MPQVAASPIPPTAAPIAATETETETEPSVRVALLRTNTVDLEASAYDLEPLGGDSAGPSEVGAGRIRCTFESADQIRCGRVVAPRFRIRSADGVRLRGQTLSGPALVGVGRDGRMTVVDEVPLETYIASVIGKEMNPRWPHDALCAQSVAARSYVLERISQLPPDALVHVEPTVIHQVYGGASSVTDSTRAAVAETRGQVLSAGGKVARAYFFAHCRGRTEVSGPVFGFQAPYLQSVACEGSETAPSLQWTRTLPLSQIHGRLRPHGLPGGGIKSVTVARRTVTGRVAAVTVNTSRGSRTFDAQTFRRVIGYTQLPSLDVDLRVQQGRLVMRGAGFGHGVGLCQWCALGMSKQGRRWTDILQHFYPGAELVAYRSLQPQPPGGVPMDDLSAEEPLIDVVVDPQGVVSPRPVLPRPTDLLSPPAPPSTLLTDPTRALLPSPPLPSTTLVNPE